MVNLWFGISDSYYLYAEKQLAITAKRNLKTNINN